MRIGLMLRHLGLQAGGTGTYTKHMVGSMLAQDQRNSYVLLYQNSSQAGTFGTGPSIQEVVLRVPGKLSWDQIAVPMAARKYSIDVLFNLKLTVPLISARPTVFVQHGADELVMRHQYPLWDRLYQSVFRRLYWARADGIICISEDARERFIAQYGEAYRAKTTIVHHGVDEQFFGADDPARIKEVRERYGIDGPFVLYLGMIYPMKNVGRIIQAYARVRERIGRKLVVAGRPFLQADDDFAWIERLQLEDHVVRTGFVPDPDVPYLMRMADLFVFPSLYEGFGIPLIEAMAAGCPVVTSAAGACPEVAGDAAMIVTDPTDVDAIAGAIVRVLEDAALRRDLIQRGKDRARQFSWLKAAAQTIRFLEDVHGARFVSDATASRR